ncbi:PKD domain-containing protein [Actinospica durhamensis]|uniref:PKD domain-containing protein n=1 Tax=Actinospica durhamensis TaxID=1508375 RepID=A0A941EN07_9ACTN|nr:PKD domain-containing protein [Actinospica durhamensis]MBR7833358.1 PKD domain-containing protein [Actinospica durhamensis]
MRPRVVAASTATLIAAASLSPFTAQAAGQNTLYVNGSSSACTDSGTGTSAAPYCTIQAAADAANPGDAVSVAAGTYAAATITRSGTADAPIVFTGNGIWSTTGMTGEAWGLLSISGASHIRIQNFGFLPGTTAPASVVSGASDITFRNDGFRSSTAGQPSLHITASSGVTVLDSSADGIDVDGGSTDTVLSTNLLYGYYTSAVSVDGATDTAITSNTVDSCGPELSVADSAAGTSIENNVLVSPISAGSLFCSSSDPNIDILVDSTSAAGTTEDYNDVVNGSGSAYEWAGTDYTTAAPLNAATGQAQHDDNAGLSTAPREGSQVINSADSAAIGEQSTDIYGHPRVLDPLVAPTGAGPYDDYDRGAVQFQDPVTKVTSSITASASKTPVGAGIILSGAATDTWSDGFDYQFKLSNGTTVDAGVGGKAVVSFTTPGTYSANLYLVPTNGATAPTVSFGSVSFTVAPLARLTPEVSTYADGKYAVDVSDYGTVDDWNVTGVTFNFGDGSAVQSTTDNMTVTHTYAKAGTYTITETVTDQSGAKASAWRSFSTNAIPAGTLVQSSALIPGLEVPANSTGIAQAASAALPNDSGELLAVTTGGSVEFSLGAPSNSPYGVASWANWKTLSQPTGVKAKWIGIAGMPNGSTQAIEITTTGKLLHTIRNANGTWQSWTSPAGSTGFVRAAIAAMPDGSAQLVAVTTSGVLMHDIRNANGSWQGWHALSQPGVKIVDASIAGVLDGSSQIAEVTSTGVLRHTIRSWNGTWQAWATPKGSPSVSQVSIGAGPVFAGSYWYEATISVVTKNGGELSDTREYDGSWDGWTGDAGNGLGNAGTAVDNTYATLPLPSGSYLTYTVTGG